MRKLSIRARLILVVSLLLAIFVVNHAPPEGGGFVSG